MNLKTMYPNYRIVIEEGGTDEPAYYLIPGRLGHVYSWGSGKLAASTNSSGSIAKRLKKLGEVWQDGTDGITVLFDAADFDKVADLLRLTQRRRLSESQRAAAVERLSKYAFRPAPRCDSEAQICVPTATLT